MDDTTTTPQKMSVRPPLPGPDAVAVSLRRRGTSLSAIAKAMGVGRTTVSEIINSKRAGRLTKATLMRYLNERELRALGWWEEHCANINREAAVRGVSRDSQP